MSERKITIRKSSLSEQGCENDLRDTTAEQRMSMVWQLTLDAWAFRGEPVAPTFPRHVARVVRGKRLSE